MKALSGTVAIVGASMLAACATTSTSDVETNLAIASAPVGAQAAVLETVFGSNASALQTNSPIYCIQAEGGDGRPDMTPQVLAALNGNPKVRPASACEIAGGGVVDRQTRQRALTFNVATQSCSSATECLIRGGYYEGNVSSQTNIYRARLVNGRWIVVLEEMGAIS